MSNKTIDLSNYSAILMLFAAILALIFSNTSLAPWYNQFLQYQIHLGYASYLMSFSMEEFVEDLLMSVFFLNITLDLKKESYEGFLSDKTQFILPMIATIGGMCVPALFYYLINYNHLQNMAGIAIPCATDIAFAMCIFNFIGARLSKSIKIFLLSIAIFDDLGAMLIIALFYNSQFSIQPLYISALLVAILFALHKKNIQSLTPYIFLAMLLWICLHQGGVNPTMAGVLLGAFIPMYKGVDKSVSPLKNMKDAIHNFVEFMILPIFAFVASGVSFVHLNFSDILNPISLGIMCGLFFGKQIGITLFTYVAVAFKIADLPAKSNWFEVYLISSLAGIGFTMSLFIGDLAFSDQVSKDYVKIAIISISVIVSLYSIMLANLRK